jgi:predicted DNA binding protein
MIEAVLRVLLPCSWVTDVTGPLGAVVNLVEQKPSATGRLQTLVEIDPGEADPNAVVETLRHNRFIRSVEAIVPPKGKILATLIVDNCHACRELANSECFLTDATASEPGGVEWRILAPKRSSVESLVKTLRQRGLEIDVVAIKTVKGSGTLTDRQDRVLSLAYKLGYFEFPKKINLTDLASKLGVSKSTLSEILRTGEEKILHAYFQGLMKHPR